MDLLLIVMLAALNFVLVFFSVVTGGSNLVMTPLLISLGVPAPSAVAATRVGNLGGSSVGLFKFHRGGMVLWGLGLPLIIVSLIGAYSGSNLVLSISGVFLQRLIGLVILGIVIIMIIDRKFGLEGRKTSTGIPSRAIGYLLYLFAVLTSSIIGGGAGILTSYILIFFFGLTFLQSSGTRKISALAGTLMASMVFILAGAVPYDIAIPLIISGALGGWSGSHFAISKGEEWARALFFVVIVLLGLKLLIF
jgi:uncharacterized membrane protein YfcA